MFSLFHARPERDQTRVTPDDHELFEGLLALLRAREDAAEHLEEQIASLLGVHRTAARCVEILLREGPLSAGELAERAGVSRSGTTPLLDRLEDAGILRRRRPSDDDRRRVEIELTPVGRATAQRFWDDLLARLSRLAQEYSREEIDAVRDFLGRANAILNGGEPPARAVTDSWTPTTGDLPPPPPPGERPPTLGAARVPVARRSRTTHGKPPEPS